MNSNIRAVNITESILRPGAATFVQMYQAMKALRVQSAVQGSSALFDANAPDEVVGENVASVDPPVTNGDALAAFALADLFVTWCETASVSLGGKTPAQVAIKLLHANALRR